MVRKEAIDTHGSFMLYLFILKASSYQITSILNPAESTVATSSYP